MMNHNIYIYIAIMALVSFFIRVLPLTLIRKQILVVRMNKNKKFQKEQLARDGYTEIKEFYKNPIQ